MKNYKDKKRMCLAQSSIPTIKLITLSNWLSRTRSLSSMLPNLLSIATT
jgi:hypothetical protein